MINITRSQPAPEILAAKKNKNSGTYLQDEVLERLQADFFNKCYICGDFGSSTLNVEHRIPHENNVELKFDWNNLYWSCGHCNNIKGSGYQPMLDCTSPEQSIPDTIDSFPNLFPKERPSFQALRDEESVNNTVSLLNDVFNGNHLKKDGSRTAP